VQMNAEEPSLESEAMSMIARITMAKGIIKPTARNRHLHMNACRRALARKRGHVHACTNYNGDIDREACGT